MRSTVSRIALPLFVALSFVMPPTLPAAAQTPPTTHMMQVDPYAVHIAEAARRFDVPPAWIRAVLRAESAGDPRAVSRKGAIGLMQIMPATWAALRVRYRLGADPYDPRDNILAGTAFLRELHDRYGSAAAMLAAYNAGPGRYEASLSGRPLPTETRAYVAAIAPTIDGGGAAGPIIVAAADPLAWTRAPLFVTQPEHKAVVDPMPAGRSPSDAPAVRKVPAVEPRSGGLFVVRAPEESQP